MKIKFGTAVAALLLTTSAALADTASGCGAACDPGGTETYATQGVGNALGLGAGVTAGTVVAGALAIAAIAVAVSGDGSSSSTTTTTTTTGN